MSQPQDLLKNLLKFCGHDPECAGNATVGKSENPWPSCDCGYEKALTAYLSHPSDGNVHDMGCKSMGHVTAVDCDCSLSRPPQGAATATPSDVQGLVGAVEYAIEVCENFPNCEGALATAGANLRAQLSAFKGAET